MDEELRRLEHEARARGDAAGFLAWASALRRAGRFIEAAGAAVEARGRGAPAEQVFPLARPPEGGGDLCAPWPHPRGDSSATGRSRVAGPGAGARVVLRRRLEPPSLDPVENSPLVLPSGDLILPLLDRASSARFLVSLDPDGNERWRVADRGSTSLTLVASGVLVREIKHLGVAELVDPLTGKLLASHQVRRTAGSSRPSARLSSILPLTFAAAAPAWGDRVILDERVLGPEGLSDLRGPGGERIWARGRAVTALDGHAYVPACTYRLAPTLGIGAPDLLIDRPSIFAYDTRGALVWQRPLEQSLLAGVKQGEVADLVAGARVVHVSIGRQRIALDRATGAEVTRGLTHSDPSSGVFLALGPDDEPIPLAPFGELASPPVVDAQGRRFGLTKQGSILGLGPSSEPLFEIALGSQAGESRLAIGPGRLYLVHGEELLAIGNA